MAMCAQRLQANVVLNGVGAVIPLSIVERAVSQRTGLVLGLEGEEEGEEEEALLPHPALFHMDK